MTRESLPPTHGIQEATLRPYAQRRHTAPRPSAKAAAAAVAVIAHGLVLLAVNAWAIDGRDLTPAVRARDPATAGPAVSSAPSPSCEADAALGTAAQLLHCHTPFGEGAGCADRVLSHFRASRITCNAVAFASDVRLITPEAIEQIEAEPLLELLEPEKQTAQPEPEPVEEPSEPEPQKMQPPPARNAQVVEITRPSTEDEPENARFLSEFNNRVDRQTVARGSTEEMVERPQPQALAVKPEPREAQIKELPPEPSETGDPDKPMGRGALAMRGPEGPRQEAQIERSKVEGGVFDGRDETPADHGVVASRGHGVASEETAAAEAGGGRGGGGRPLVPNLRPDEDILERIAGGGSVDHLDDVAQGEATALNSKKWKYATFFNRMKRGVAQHWNPAEIYTRRDPNGNVYGRKDRVTFLQVSLDPTGAITRIHVVQSCGLDFLDEEAVRAFRAAHPFPNPPKGLVDLQSRRITFTFGFHFEIGNRQGWKIFRGR